MQIDSVVTVKQAATSLGVERQALEQRLESGQLRGKKEKILSKDVWFIYKSELDALLAQKEQRLFGEPPEAKEANRTYLGPDDWAAATFATFDFAPEQQKQLPAEGEKELPLVEQFQLSLRLMSEEFSRCMQSSLEHIQQLREQLKEADSKLLLLVDMEKRAHEDRQQLEDKDAALALAHQRIANLQSEVERLSRPWWQKLFG